MECHSKGNVTKFEMSLTLECHLNWNVTQKKCHCFVSVRLSASVENALCPECRICLVNVSIKKIYTSLKGENINVEKWRRKKTCFLV